MPVYRTLFYIVTSFLLLGNAHAAIYKSIGPEGQVMFSDQKTPRAVQVILPKVVPLSQPSQSKPQQWQNTVAKPSTLTPSPHQINHDNLKVKITSPTNKTTLHTGSGLLTVSFKAPSYIYQRNYSANLLIDGVVKSTINTGFKFTVSNISRGEHQLKVTINNRQGKPLADSAPVTVYVHRPSVLLKK